MTSESNNLSTSVVDDGDLENVELHRAESMVNEDIDIPEQTKNIEKVGEIKPVYVSFGAKARLFCSEVLQMKIEVIMFLYMFSYVLRSVTSTSMLMDKVCLVHLGNSDEVCKNLTGHPALKIIVEKMANNYHLAHSSIQMVPSAILCLFVGAWSDKYSRKVPIIVALIGIIIDGCGATICAYLLKTRIEYYLFTGLFTGISGGFIGVLTVLYSYASDISSSDNRTWKYALMEMAFGLSMPLGSLAGGWIFKFFHYVPVFVTSTCGHLLGLFWVIFVLEETRGLDTKESWKVKFRNFWSTDSVVSSFKATQKKRPNRGREQIWGLLVAMSISVLSFAATAGVGFIYVLHRYDWDNTIYSTVSAIFSVIGIVVMLIIVPLSKKFHISDAILGLVGSVSLFLKMLGVGLASKPHFYFLASLLGLFSGLGTLAGRSRISKVASKEDLGKVFSFVTTAESILPIVATAIVSQVFNASLDIFPGMIYVVMAVLILIPIGIFVWLVRLPAVNYEEMNNAHSEEEKYTGLVTHSPLRKTLEKSNTKNEKLSKIV